ncbi:MAG: hypothetical protein AUG49_18625 [Catenulispora sp. 13_1_20CM_3_70_7]|nr:MAG: hypothetical protein AUG49_18625 [Catenulispora sp. 13_1_20CM_3_70_7]
MTTATPAGAALARRFWQRTLYDLETMAAQEGRGIEGGPDQPPPVTVRRGTPRYPLPAPATRLGAAAAFDLTTLSTLLQYTYGIARLELGRGAHWPLHRTVASARCFYPTELYCVLPATGDLPAGAYAYDPVHHSLVAVRCGDARAAVHRAVGPAGDGAVLAMVLSTMFWRTAFMYRNYAYRLVTQEAGLVAGNALLVAGELGLRGRLHHRFDQAVVEDLLAVTWPDESVLSVLTLHPGDTPERPGSAGRPSVPPTGVGPPPDTDRPAVDPLRCAELTALDAAARTGPAGGRLAPVPSRTTPAREDRPDLADVLRWRHSGGDVFNPVRRPVPLSTVARVVRHALDPYPSDATEDGAGPAVSCYVWTPSVSDAPPGVYRLVAGRLRALADSAGAAAGLQQAADRAGTAGNVNYRTANLVAFVVADIAAATRVLGARSVRVLSQEAGVVAHRICVGSAAESLAARIHNGYPAGTVATALGLPADQTALFQIVAGAVAPTARYQLPIGGSR